MKKPLKDIKIVIIEDDQEKSDELVEILYGLGFNLDNLKSDGYAENGIELINDELPDVVLLDLKIPYNKNDRSIKIDNSNKVIKEIERLNAIRNQEDSSTGIIIISASIDDVGLRKNYKHITEVVDFFDKDEIALNKDKFKSELLKKILFAVETDFRHICEIELIDIIAMKLKKLESINKKLHDRIMIDIIDQFKKLNDKKVNEFNLSKSIISSCGEVVEDIIHLFNGKINVISGNYTNDEGSVLSRLTKLSGRKFIGRDNNESIYELDGEIKIRRISQEYALLAYRMRSQALHSKEGDVNHNKWFSNHKFSKEDASISLNLIFPLVQDYIDYMVRK